MPTYEEKLREKYPQLTDEHIAYLLEVEAAHRFSRKFNLFDALLEGNNEKE